MNDIMSKIKETTDYIRSHINATPDIAVILGSGLGDVFDDMTSSVTLKYEDIPNFKASTVAGHAGELVFGTYNNRNILVMKGRFHYYEGHEMDVTTFPIRVFAALGVKKLVLTNAAGGISDALNPGSIMLINDHLSFMCPSPLRGPNLDEFGPRFKDMTEVYTVSLRDLSKKIASDNNISLKEGVYCYFKGPQYETPAEIRAVKMLGADAAGMSTVPEAIVARHCGMEILGISLITNKAAGLSGGELSHEEVTATAALAKNNIVTLLRNVIGEM